MLRAHPDQQFAAPGFLLQRFFGEVQASLVAHDLEGQGDFGCGQEMVDDIDQAIVEPGLGLAEFVPGLLEQGVVPTVSIGRSFGRSGFERADEV